MTKVKDQHIKVIQFLLHPLKEFCLPEDLHNKYVESSSVSQQMPISRPSSKHNSTDTKSYVSKETWTMDEQSCFHQCHQWWAYHFKTIFWPKQLLLLWRPEQTFQDNLPSKIDPKRFVLGHLNSNSSENLPPVSSMSGLHFDTSPKYKTINSQNCLEWPFQIIFQIELY